MEFISKEVDFKNLHLLPLKLLKVIVKHAYTYSSNYQMIYDWKEFYYQAKILGSNLRENEFQLCCKGILGLITWLLQNNPENSGKYTFRNILSTHSSIEEDDINDLEADYEDWKNQYPGIGILKSGLQLIDLDWRAGISVATDSSKNLNVPYIQLLLKFVNPQTGNTSDTTISLDYQSFIAFLRDVRKINGLLATYN